MNPIAIVGRACLLPGAASPAELWTLVSEGRSALAPVPPGRWRVAREQMLVSAEAIQAGGEGCVTDRGGFVEGFARLWNPDGFRIDPAEIASLDALVHWLLHVGREALRDAGTDPSKVRTGAILGNLGYPTDQLVDYAEWRLGRRRTPVDPRNRFSTGLPLNLLASALGLSAGGHALDAACASSLYAVKRACDWLAAGRADVMLAGGVNRCDALTIHAGFTALRALSPTGQSRPFHRDADGLVPAEGAAMVVLKRLADAERAGDAILGVIRGIGLSNDGRGGGLLAPSEAGQARAMRAAFAGSGIEPANVSLVECHATGTVLGDAAELRSMANVYRTPGLAIGSLKSNLGHLVTAAGAAGIIKLIEALAHDTKPPSRGAAPVTDALAGTGFRVLSEPEPWQRDGVRRAAISGFGFGGNNAHLLLEDHVPAKTPRSPVAKRKDRPAIAVVGIGAMVAAGEGVEAFTRALVRGESQLREIDGVGLGGVAERVRLAGTKLGAPPRDMARALAQQTMLIAAADEALKGIATPAAERVSVLVGIQCDVEGSRPVLRLGATTAAEKDAIDAPLDTARVVGCMGNVPANRINRQHGFEGPSFSFFAEELSGVHALEAAVAALAAGEADMVVVGAADACVEPVHAAAAAAVLPADRKVPGDAACVLVLKRAADAERDGDRVLARIGEVTFGGGARGASAIGQRIPELFGHAHAASGLLEVTAAVALLHRGVMLGADGSAQPLLPRPTSPVMTMTIEALGDQRATVSVAASGAPPADPVPLADMPDFRLYAGDSIAALRDALAQDRFVHVPPVAGAMRLVLVGQRGEMEARIAKADMFLALKAEDAEPGPAPEGVFFRSAPIGGETAFVYTGAAAAYAGMGRTLALAFPGLVHDLGERCVDLEARAGWVYTEPAGTVPGDFAQLAGCSFLCQLHAGFTRDVLGILPDAAIGLSSGETNALYALGFWKDMGALLDDVEAAGLYTDVLGGRAEAVHAARASRGLSGEGWASFRVVAPLGVVEAAIAAEPTVHLTIVNAPGDFVVAGAAAAAGRVVETIGRARATPLAMELAVHCRDAELAAPLWRKLHHRPVTPQPGLRLYANAIGGAYLPDADSVADMLTAQAVERVDFPRTIRQAWEDGVRVFIEHGPRAQCTQSIRATLGDRPHLAVALDSPGRDSLRQALYAAGELVAAGVDVDVARLRQMLRLDRAVATPRPGELILAAHPAPVPPPVGAAEKVAAEYVMRPAPRLAPPGGASPPPSQPRSTPTPVMTRPALVPVPPPAALPVLRSSAPLPPPGVAGRVAQAIADTHTRMTAEHRAFLARMTALAAQFERLPSLIPVAGALIPPRDILSPDIPSPEIPSRVTAPAAAPLMPAAISNGASSAPPTAEPLSTPTGPRFSRSDLEHLASGRIADLFGDAFAAQEFYDRQVRMPMPPLLLADRVTGLAAEARSMGRGTIWTETDVVDDAWYLADGHMPAGIMIEAGQADLLLVSWLGADLRHGGDRIYRLLGCELTYHGGLPRRGDTLAYDIHIDGHAQLGGIGMFFFHYDARVDGALRLSVRNGQAGFFTDRELANSEGVLWSAATSQPTPAGTARLDTPHRLPDTRTFDAQRTAAFYSGDLDRCFGAGFERSRLHTRTPTPAAGRMRLLHAVPAFDPAGGPWGRGYLRAEWPVAPDDWFFAGHFKNDPCMPGTLMFEACLQAMAFAMSGLGLTLERDGWRFEPVPDTSYALRCRGQVTPASSLVTYEIFVDEVIAGPVPTLFADVLASVDGLKAFHCARLGLRLVPAWPLDEMPVLIDRADAPPSANVPGIVFGPQSLIACALGRPSDAFGPLFRPLDGPLRIPRLPRPPYHFMTRVTHLEGEIGKPTIGTLADVEYDMPADSWYFVDNHRPVLPFSVLIEAMLQTCGWLASFIGDALKTNEDLFFRHLDGTGSVLSEIPAGTRVLKTRVKLTSLSRMGTTSITGFVLETSADGVDVARFDTVFGSFPGAALAMQVGIAATDAERSFIAAEDTPGAVAENIWRSIAHGQLKMIDRVSGFWPTGGAKGLGRLRAVKEITGDEWFFKAHFLNDPVQPASLGLEGVLQAMQAFMLATRDPADRSGVTFAPIALDEEAGWKCRGQVLPHHARSTILIEVIEDRADAAGRTVIATGSLWADAKKIYAITRIGLTMTCGEAVPTGAVFDPAVETWVGDHRPTYTVPALPMMAVLDRVAMAAEAAAGAPAVEVSGLSLNGWFLADAPRRIQAETTGVEQGVHDVRLTFVAIAPMTDRPAVAHARVRTADRYPPAPERWPLPADLVAVHGPNDGGPDLYATGELFHGPAFQVLREVRRSASGAVASIDAGGGAVPFGALNPAMLDGVVQAIPNDRLHRWYPDVPTDRIGYPSIVETLVLYLPMPHDGLVEAIVRPDGFADARRTQPRIAIQLAAGGRVIAEGAIRYVLFPAGAIGTLPPLDRRAFLRDRQPVAAALLGRHRQGATVVTPADIAGSDWLPGTLSAAFDLRHVDQVLEIAAKQHAAPLLDVHPAMVDVTPDGREARTAALPFNVVAMAVKADGGARSVSSASVVLDTAPVRAFWDRLSNAPDSPIGDLYQALIVRFVRRIAFADPATRATIAAGPVMFLCNHQVAVESPLFSLAAGAATGRRIVTIAKSEHRDSWIGRLIDFAGRYPGASPRSWILHFDRSDAGSFFDVLARYRAQLDDDAPSLMVHVEGTRSLDCRTPVSRVSAVLLDFAIAAGLPVVPTRMVGGLPIEPLARRIEFPIGLGRQDYVLGRAIAPHTLAALPLAERGRLVCDAINALAPPVATEQPFATGEEAVVDDADVARVLIATLRGAAVRGAASDVLLAMMDGASATGHDAAEPWLRDFAAWLAELAGGGG